MKSSYHCCLDDDDGSRSFKLELRRRALLLRQDAKLAIYIWYWKFV